MKPTVGRIVHYVGAEPKCLAAIVVRVDDRPHSRSVHLAVFADPHERHTVAPNPIFNAMFVAEGPKGRAHTWHWPEREEAE